MKSDNNTQASNLPKISQSLMKGLSEYVQGLECGIAFRAKYITKTMSTPPSDAMRLGIYFEYMATGALPRSGEKPEPDVVYKGKPNERMSADYERATASAEYFKSLMKYWDIKTLHTNFTMETETMKGIADLVVEWNGKPAIFDLKYTGLIDDKWSDMGWHKDFLSQKDNLLVQGVMYKLLAKEVLGIEDIDFYFWVFDSKNPLNVRIIKEEVDGSRFETHIEAVNSAKNYITYHEKLNDWTPRPELLRCANCPLKPNCEHAVDYPHVEQVYY
jgi:hypothetical protein